MTTKRIFIYLAFFLIIPSVIFTQSDYRITQEFKSRQRAFEIAIEYAKTGDELNKIKKEIEEFKNEFRGSKDLLNRALYPNNFESTFKILDKKIVVTNKKLAEISILKTKVTSIQSNFEKVTKELKKISNEIFSLRNNNRKLMSELNAFRSGYGGSKESIDSLNNLISQLKLGISQRDTLIKEVMDNIFMTVEHKLESLDDVEKSGIRTQIKNISLINNINNLISDNIEFLNASLFTSDDLVQLRNEFDDFQQRWTHFGPKLFNIYSTDNQNKEKLGEIDSLITDWGTSLNYSIWKSIQGEFNSFNIDLDEFKNGFEFESAVVGYINTEINKGSNVQKDQNYIFFSERVWNETIKTKWLPFLFNNNQFSQDQVNIIDQKIEEWKSNSGGSKSIFIYGIIALLAIIILVSIFLILRKNKKATELNSPKDKSYSVNDENKIGSGEEFIDDEKE